MQLTHDHLIGLFVALCLMLGLARLLGELARRWRQPAVVGELLAGVLLGPSVLGQFAPEFVARFFPLAGTIDPSNAPLSVALNAFTAISIVCFLLVAGMEVDLSTAWRQGRTAIFVSLMGIAVPFVTGYYAAGFLGPEMHGHANIPQELFALFFGTAMCISALPVISRILMDLNLFKTDLGMVVIAAAVVDDLIGWIIFALILGFLNGGGGAAAGTTFLGTILFAVLILTIGRWLLDKALPLLQAHLSWPGGVLGMAITGAFACAAFTEWIGIHAIFGAFLFGVALGDSRHLREHTRTLLDQFISFIFAPIFFASVGLRVNFVENFDLGLVIFVLLIACIGKVLGCWLGASMGGLKRREALAIGFGMNARGAMEIILGLLALQAGLISEKLFVALVVMALVTSMMSGSVMEYLLRGRRRKLALADLLSARHFAAPVAGADRASVIARLCELGAAAAGRTAEELQAAVMAREDLAPTGVGNGVAVPHARLAGLAAPVVVVGISTEGVDFDAPDGARAKLIFLILTPEADQSAQLDVLAEVASLAVVPGRVEEFVRVSSFTQALAVLRTTQVSGNRLVP